MLKSESQMCVRFGTAVSGKYWSIRLKQCVEDDVQLRDSGNFNFLLAEVLFNIYFIFRLRPASFCDIQPSLISRDARITPSSTC